MNPQPPAVSVILPTYNRAGLLPRAIASVLRQTFADFELIVVDDASTDDTMSVVGSIQDPRLRYIRLPANRGAPEARNRGITEANGNLVAFQDSDDEWLPEKLARQVAKLNACPTSVAANYCGFTRYERRTSLYIPEPKVACVEGRITSSLLIENFVSTQTLIVRKTLLESVGGFDERLKRLQDWDLVLRLSRETVFSYIEDPLVLVYETPGNISSFPLNDAVARCLIVDKLDEEFRKSPSAKAKHLFIAGLTFLRHGQLPEARRALVNAIRTHPTDWKPWAALASSYLGIAV